jgi:short-subunit dehydrogenase
MSRRLHALVIGGSRGIGFSIAQLLARNKYSITLLSRTEPALKVAIATLNGHKNPSSFGTSKTNPTSCSSS